MSEPEESEIIKQMFDEITKMIRQKHIKLESIIHRTLEQDIISQDSFERIYRLVTEHGKKKHWID
ncbi:MAG: hypothetical protein ABI342_07010 [Nitrososphaera sp.]|jgi:hypothetical protein